MYRLYYLTSLCTGFLISRLSVQALLSHISVYRLYSLTSLCTAFILSHLWVQALVSHVSVYRLYYLTSLCTGLIFSRLSENYKEVKVHHREGWFHQWITLSCLKISTFLIKKFGKSHRFKTVSCFFAPKTVYSLHKCISIANHLSLEINTVQFFLIFLILCCRRWGRGP